MKIEKNIPIPTGKATKYPWAEMEVGDSFLFECEYSNSKQTNLHCNAIGWSKRNRIESKYVTKKVDGGVRIWRIK